MKNVLVIGAGRFGRYTTIKLHDLGHQTMVVDKDEERINKILPYASDAQIGDSTDPGFMASIGVSDYDLCIVAIGDDCDTHEIHITTPLVTYSQIQDHIKDADCGYGLNDAEIDELFEKLGGKIDRK